MHDDSTRAGRCVEGVTEGLEVNMFKNRIDKYRCTHTIREGYT